MFSQFRGLFCMFVAFYSLRTLKLRVNKGFDSTILEHRWFDAELHVSCTSSYIAYCGVFFARPSCFIELLRCMHSSIIQRLLGAFFSKYQRVLEYCKRCTVHSNPRVCTYMNTTGMVPGTNSRIKELEVAELQYLVPGANCWRLE